VIANWIRESYRRNRLLTLVAAAHLAAFLCFGIASLIDERTILGINPWFKPMKFAISIAIFTGTMAWLLGYLQNSARAVRVISGIIAVTMLGEMVLIATQSARGVQSHFNHQTGFDDAIFSAMGVLIVINTVATAHGVWLFYRRPTTANGALLTGIRVGMIIFVLASLEGGLMVAKDSHSVGVHDGGPGLPFINWSTGAGDLRVAHFVGMHALQLFPLLGWFLDRRGVISGRRWVAFAAMAYFVIAAFLVVQALAGRPLLAAS
jgi:hypothetical protein